MATSLQFEARRLLIRTNTVQIYPFIPRKCRKPLKMQGFDFGTLSAQFDRQAVFMVLNSYVLARKALLEVNRGRRGWS